MAEPMEFVDISTEEWREYRFPEGETVRIDAPLKLNVSKSGGHRIVDTVGDGHYVPSGWLHIHWKNKPGAEPIVA